MAVLRAAAPNGISLKPREFSAFHRAVGEDFGEIGLGHGKDPFAGECVQSGAQMEFCYGGFGRICVVRANELAFVAAVDTVAQRLA